MPDLNPNESDLVLGGQNPPPANAAILGGLSGARQRLKSESIAERLWALNNTVQYGDNAIDLALGALTDEAHEVRRLAKRLLRDRLGQAGKTALLDCEPMDYFTTFNDWNQERYNPAVGLIDPENNAYIVTIKYDGFTHSFDTTLFDALIKDVSSSHLQALIINLSFTNYNFFHGYSTEGIALDVFRLVINNQDKLVRLKALYFGDKKEDVSPLDRKSDFYIKDISILLNGMPNLELLYIYGGFAFYDLTDLKLKHNKLKTLVIDAVDSPLNLYSICPNKMPDLEYLEIWLAQIYYDTPFIETLMPIISGCAAPHLKYLGLCNGECIDRLIEEILNAPIMKDIVVLNFKMGAMSSSGLEDIISQYNMFGNLKLLNVEQNCICDNITSKYTKLPFKVELANQYQSSHERDYEIGRYWVSNE